MNEKEQFSKLVQQFKTTEYYALLYEKLNNDWKKHSDTLRNREDEQVRGRIKYIEELFAWIDSKSKEELAIEDAKIMIGKFNDW